MYCSTVGGDVDILLLLQFDEPEQSSSDLRNMSGLMHDLTESAVQSLSQCACACWTHLVYYR